MLLVMAPESHTTPTHDTSFVVEGWKVPCLSAEKASCAWVMAAQWIGVGAACSAVDFMFLVTSSIPQ